MFRKILPKEISFYDYFDQLIEQCVLASKEFLVLADAKNNTRTSILRIKEIEHEADSITHQCIKALHQTFITPFDRAYIHQLIKQIDDIVDAIDAASARIGLYGLEEIQSEAIELGQVLVRSCVELKDIIAHLRNMKHASMIIEKCHQVHLLENEGDVVLRSALVRLFKDASDPVLIIKWKEVFELLERATDRCEDVANIIEGIVIEAT